MLCKVCGSVTREVTNSRMFMCPPNEYPLLGELSLAVCLRCSFVSNQSGSTFLDYERYYLNFNKHQLRDEASVSRDFEYFSNLLDFMVAGTGFGLEGKSVLDYGSGTRQFSHVALMGGARHADNVDVGIDFLSVEYDWIVSTHCFEHLLDPLADLKNLVEHTAQRGYVCIAVPDLARYGETYYGPRAHFDLEHINHFSYPSLIQLFEEAGLRVVAHRRIDRMVGPTLAYPEVLIIGHKMALGSDESARESFDVVSGLEDLFAKYDADIETTLSAFDKTLASVTDADATAQVIVGFFGLASYAFRIIEILRNERPGVPLSFFADSDPRLSGMSLNGEPVLDLPGYESFVAEYVASGRTVVTFIAAINGWRILDMLTRKEPAFNSLVVLLPPDCQNRKD